MTQIRHCETTFFPKKWDFSKNVFSRTVKYAWGHIMNLLIPFRPNAI